MAKPKYLTIILLAILGCISIAVIAAQDPPVHQEVQYEVGSDFKWRTSGCRRKCSLGVAIRSQRFGVYINATLWEPCWVLGLNFPGTRENHKMCSELGSRIESLTNCFLKDGCAGIVLMNLTVTDSRRYFLDSEDVCYCTKRFSVELYVFAKDVATNETIATTPGTVTTPAAKPVAKSSYLTHVPVMLLLSILMFTVVL